MRPARATVAGLTLVVGMALRPAGAMPQDASGLHVSEMKVLTPAGLERVRTWARLVQAHQPGQLDGSANALADWRESDTTLVLSAVKCLYSSAAPAVRRGSSATFAACGRPFSADEIDSLFGLAGDHDLIPLLHRAVLLYTDLALYPTAPAEPGHGGALMVEDAHGAGRLDTEFNWACARWLLTSVRADWRDDPMVASWFVATTAFLESQLRLGEALPNVNRGLDLVPDDARFAFEAGALHETFASARTRNTVIVAVVPADMRIDVNDEASELSAAQRWLRRSLQLADRPDVHLHLGRVLDGLGRHEEALRELAAALPLSDRDLEYDAALFSGQAEAALDRRTEAEAALERAAGLFPKAQSPLLALSQLGRLHDDEPAAEAAIDRLRALPPETARRDDPWWRYATSHVRDADALMAALRRPYVRAVPR